ncbi:hypothetical protein EG832_01780 [bacterium]|nr:hypothetical protein [bacterium]
MAALRQRDGKDYQRTKRSTGGLEIETMNLPNTWKSELLENYMVKGGGNVDPSKYPNEQFDLYSIPAYDSQFPEIARGSEIGSTKKIVKENDILLSRIVPHIQRSWVVGRDVGRRQIGSGEWMIFRGESFIPKYMRYFLLSYDFHMKLMTTISGVGGSLTRATPTLVGKFTVPLPPLPEQRRIVAKIEELFSSLDKGIESLKTAQQQLKVYRQAVLKWAFEGRLTNPDVKDGELPKGWKLEMLVDVAEKIADGEHFRPKTQSTGVPFLSAKDVRDAGVSFDDPLYISDQTAKKAMQRCNPEIGDILIVSRGATVGRMCIVKTERKFCLLGSVILIKVKKTLNSQYLTYALKSPSINQKLISLSGATAQQAIYLRDIKNIEIPIPPAIEQHAIVAEIESRLSVCDKIEESIEESLRQAEALRQSILKKAFEGKLVPQNPNDEPASKLLEHIKAQKEKTVGTKRSKN